MQTYLQSPNALSTAEIHSLAEQNKVGICLYGGTQSPSKGRRSGRPPAASFALRHFMKAVGFSGGSKPSYSGFRRTNTNRWE
jgi:hypothetical protein